MRVIAGSLGGRVFQAPKGHKTHPMGDRIKGGLFNALGDISGLSVLDAFGGSGALAIEAISRGAASATVLEPDRQAKQTIDENIAQLGIGAAIKATKATAGSWSDTNQAKLFDIVICDPPYDDLQLGTLQKLVHHVRSGGIMVISWPGKMIPAELVGMTQAKNLTYGDAQLVFYKKLS
ncbi:MAG: RsmD family RNA methyltransferase [Candidatus Saccharibacteria bacterium]|nr:RsmD family RNA methyltransferase [Candidatus Saccharibacteria bacterium]